MRVMGAAACGLWLSATFVGGAWAQGDAEATRQALIQEAAAASQSGDHARAIDRARRAAAIRMSASLRFLLAREELAVGLPLEAHTHAAACIDEVAASPALANGEMLRARCEALRDETERSLARLTVRLPSPRPTALRVVVDGIPADLAQLDVARVRLPGAVEVVATAEGFERFRETRTLSVGERATITLALRRPPPAVAGPVAPPPARAEPRSTSFAGPWALGGVAAAGLISVAVLGGLALDAQRARDARCATAASCDLAGAAAADARYRELATGANVSLAVASGFAVAALTWWLVARGSRATSRVTATPAALVMRW
jgi:hypothetical protein